MDPRLARLALCVLASVALLLPPSTEGCSCAMQHPQDHFCKADYVIKAKIKRVESVLGQDGREAKKNYTIIINKKFKVPDAYKDVRRAQLYTAGSGAMCGVNLNRTQTYLIMGSLYEDNLQVSICDLSRPWADVSRSQKRSLRSRYSQNCDCKINVCWSPKCQKKSLERNSCRWNPREDPGSCFAKHSLCRRGNGLCKWARNPDWKTCVAEVEAERRREP